MKLFKNFPKELLVLKIIFTIISLIVWVIFISIMYSIGMPGKFEVKPPDEGDISWEKKGDFLVLNTEVGIVNKGLWDITDLNLKIDIKNTTNYYAVHYSKFVDKIPHGKETKIPINIKFNLHEHYEKTGEDWLLNDQDLKIEIFAKTKYAKSLIEFSTAFTQKSRWGSPLSGLKIEKPRIVDNNVNTTFYFFNNASYDLNLNVNAILYDKNDKALANANKNIYAEKNGFYINSIEIHANSIENAKYVQFLFSDKENFIDYQIEKKLGGY